MKIYKSCNTLPIQNFFEVFKDNDYRYLIVGFDDENDTFKLSEKRKEELGEIFKDIYYKYAEITENHKLLAIFKKTFLIEQWEFIYKVIVNAMYFYMESAEVEFLKSINRLEEKNYTINLDEPLDKQVVGMVGKMKGLKTKIKIFKLKLNKKPLDKEKPKEVDLEKTAIYLERHLELQSPVDPKTTNITRWVHLTQLSNEKSKRDGRSNT